MPDASTCLGRPDAQTDGDGSTDENAPANPGGLPRKFNQGQQRKKGQNADGINYWGRDLGPLTMLAKSRLSHRIHARVDGAIGKRFLGGLPRFHHERHRPNAEQHRHET